MAKRNTAISELRKLMASHSVSCSVGVVAEEREVNVCDPHTRDLEASHLIQLQVIDQQCLELGPFERVNRDGSKPSSSSASSAAHASSPSEGSKGRKWKPIGSQKSGRKGSVRGKDGVDDQEKDQQKSKRASKKASGPAATQKSATATKKQQQRDVFLEQKPDHNASSSPSIIPAASELEMMSLYFPSQRDSMEDPPVLPSSENQGAASVVVPGEVLSPPNFSIMPTDKTLSQSSSSSSSSTLLSDNIEHPLAVLSPAGTAATHSPLAFPSTPVERSPTSTSACPRLTPAPTPTLAHHQLSQASPTTPVGSSVKASSTSLSSSTAGQHQTPPLPAVTVSSTTPAASHHQHLLHDTREEGTGLTVKLPLVGEGTKVGLLTEKEKDPAVFPSTCVPASPLPLSASMRGSSPASAPSMTTVTAPCSSSLPSSSSSSLPQSLSYPAFTDLHMQVAQEQSMAVSTTENSRTGHQKASNSVASVPLALTPKVATTSVVGGGLQDTLLLGHDAPVHLPATSTSSVSTPTHRSSPKPLSALRRLSNASSSSGNLRLERRGSDDRKSSRGSPSLRTVQSVPVLSDNSGTPPLKQHYMPYIAGLTQVQESSSPSPVLAQSTGGNSNPMQMQSESSKLEGNPFAVWTTPTIQLPTSSTPPSSCDPSSSSTAIPQYPYPQTFLASNWIPLRPGATPGVLPVTMPNLRPFHAPMYPSLDPANPYKPSVFGSPYIPYRYPISLQGLKPPFLNTLPSTQPQTPSTSSAGFSFALTGAPAAGLPSFRNLSDPSNCPTTPIPPVPPPTNLPSLSACLQDGNDPTRQQGTDKTLMPWIGSTLLGSSLAGVPTYLNPTFNSTFNLGMGLPQSTSISPAQQGSLVNLYGNRLAVPLSSSLLSTPAPPSDLSENPFGWAEELRLSQESHSQLQLASQSHRQAGPGKRTSQQKNKKNTSAAHHYQPSDSPQPSSSTSFNGGHSIEVPSSIQHSHLDQQWPSSKPPLPTSSPNSQAFLAQLSTYFPRHQHGGRGHVAEAAGHMTNALEPLVTGVPSTVSQPVLPGHSVGGGRTSGKKTKQGQDDKNTSKCDPVKLKIHQLYCEDLRPQEKGDKKRKRRRNPSGQQQRATSEARRGLDPALTATTGISLASLVEQMQPKVATGSPVSNPHPLISASVSSSGSKSLTHQVAVAVPSFKETSPTSLKTSISPLPPHPIPSTTTSSGSRTGTDGGSEQLELYTSCSSGLDILAACSTLQSEKKQLDPVIRPNVSVTNASNKEESATEDTRTSRSSAVASPLSMAGANTLMMLVGGSSCQSGHSLESPSSTSNLQVESTSVDPSAVSVTDVESTAADSLLQLSNSRRRRVLGSPEFSGEVEQEEGGEGCDGDSGVSHSASYCAAEAMLMIAQRGGGGGGNSKKHVESKGDTLRTFKPPVFPFSTNETLPRSTTAVHSSSGGTGRSEGMAGPKRKNVGPITSSTRVDEDTDTDSEATLTPTSPEGPKDFSLRFSSSPSFPSSPVRTPVYTNSHSSLSEETKVVMVGQACKPSESERDQHLDSPSHETAIPREHNPQDCDLTSSNSTCEAARVGIEIPHSSLENESLSVDVCGAVEEQENTDCSTVQCSDEPVKESQVAPQKSSTVEEETSLANEPCLDVPSTPTNKEPAEESLTSHEAATLQDDTSNSCPLSIGEEEKEEESSHSVDTDAVGLCPTSISHDIPLEEAKPPCEATGLTHPVPNTSTSPGEESPAESESKSCVDVVAPSEPEQTSEPDSKSESEPASKSELEPASNSELEPASNSELEPALMVVKADSDVQQSLNEEEKGEESPHKTTEPESNSSSLELESKESVPLDQIHDISTTSCNDAIDSDEIEEGEIQLENEDTVEGSESPRRELVSPSPISSPTSLQDGGGIGAMLEAISPEEEEEAILKEEKWLEAEGQSSGSTVVPTTATDDSFQLTSSKTEEKSNVTTSPNCDALCLHPSISRTDRQHHSSNDLDAPSPPQAYSKGPSSSHTYGIQKMKRFDKRAISHRLYKKRLSSTDDVDTDSSSSSSQKRHCRDTDHEATTTSNRNRHSRASSPADFHRYSPDDTNSSHLARQHARWDGWGDSKRSSSRPEDGLNPSRRRVGLEGGPVRRDDSRNRDRSPHRRLQHHDKLSYEHRRSPPLSSISRMDKLSHKRSGGGGGGGRRDLRRDSPRCGSPGGGVHLHRGSGAQDSFSSASSSSRRQQHSHRVVGDVVRREGKLSHSKSRSCTPESARLDPRPPLEPERFGTTGDNRHSRSHQLQRGSRREKWDSGGSNIRKKSYESISDDEDPAGAALPPGPAPHPAHHHHHHHHHHHLLKDNREAAMSNGKSSRSGSGQRGSLSVVVAADELDKRERRKRCLSSGSSGGDEEQQQQQQHLVSSGSAHHKHRKQHHQKERVHDRERWKRSEEWQQKQQQQQQQQLPRPSSGQRHSHSNRDNV